MRAPSGIKEDQGGGGGGRRIRGGGRRERGIEREVGEGGRVNETSVIQLHESRPTT